MGYLEESRALLGTQIQRYASTFGRLLVTLFTTILAGVSVFVFGQIFLKWMIEPVQKLRKVIGEVLFYLLNDNSTIHNAEIDKNEALSVGKNLERLGASLLSSQQLIPFYIKVSKVCGLPRREGILFASKRLSLISKSMFGKEQDIHYKLDLYRIEICEALGIEDPVQNGMTKQELKDGIREIRNQ